MDEKGLVIKKNADPDKNCLKVRHAFVYMLCMLNRQSKVYLFEILIQVYMCRLRDLTGFMGILSTPLRYSWAYFQYISALDIYVISQPDV